MSPPRPQREPIYKAMFAMVSPLQAVNKGGLTDAAPFVKVTREVIECQRVPEGEQPVLMQYEYDEANGYSGVDLIQKVWTVIYIIGVTHPKGTPGVTLLNPLIDAVETIFLDAIDADTGKNTLGGLVDNVQLIGSGGKDHGDNSTKTEMRQSAYYLPVEITLPGS